MSVAGKNNRAFTDSELSSFYDGRQFRIVQALSVVSGTPYNVKLSRGVDMIMRGFTIEVTSGEIVCNVWRNPTISGTFSDSITVIPKNESSARPSPYYETHVKFEGGTANTFTGGSFRDLIDIKATGSSGGGGGGGGVGSTTAGARNDGRGCPANSWDIFSFTNPVSGTAIGILSMWWEELA